MSTIKIFLSLDHELPLGKLNTTYQKALFDSTDRILKLADELNIKITLFTDVLCAMRFKEWDKENFYNPYISQLQSALRKGHDIQLHLHPHWLTSTFKNGVVTPSSDFKLSNFKNKEYPNNIPGIIKSSYSFLKDVCQEAKTDYKCVAYRAGGHCLSPDSDILFSELYKNGIRYDSSICKGFYFKSAVSEVDFTHVPSVPNWLIDEKGNYNTISKSGILEIPIAGRPKSLLEVPTWVKMKRYKDRAAENHGSQIHEVGMHPTSTPGNSLGQSLSHKIKQALSSRLLNFDNYTYSPNYLMKILKYHVNQYSANGGGENNPILLSVLGHPKSMGDYSLFLMKSFVENTRKKYGNAVEFYTFQQLFDES